MLRIMYRHTIMLLYSDAHKICENGCVLKKDIKSKNFEQILKMWLPRKDYHMIKTLRDFLRPFFVKYTHTQKKKPDSFKRNLYI